MIFASPAAADLAFSFTSGIDVAVTAPAYTADGELNLTIGFEPTPGTHLTVVKITGPAFIAGTFSNATQGATVPLTAAVSFVRIRLPPDLLSTMERQCGSGLYRGSK